MSYLIVVSHYKENLDWLKEFDRDKILVFDKNDETTEYPTINIPNLGRESNTYLRYILDNYDTLPDIVVFMQGKDDHLSTVNIKHFLKKMEYFPARKMEGRLVIFDVSKLGFNKQYRIPTYGGNTLIPAESDFVTWFKTHIRGDLPKYFCIIWGACFLVRREAIRSRPIEFYNRLYLETCVGEATEVGHFLERSWYYIFT